MLIDDGLFVPIIHTVTTRCSEKRRMDKLELGMDEREIGKDYALLPYLSGGCRIPFGSHLPFIGAIKCQIEVV